jgi:hypothetical protein
MHLQRIYHGLPEEIVWGFASGMGDALSAASAVVATL